VEVAQVVQAVALAVARVALRMAALPAVLEPEPVLLVMLLAAAAAAMSAAAVSQAAAAPLMQSAMPSPAPLLVRRPRSPQAQWNSHPEPACHRRDQDCRCIHRSRVQACPSFKGASAINRAMSVRARVVPANKAVAKASKSRGRSIRDHCQSYRSRCRLFRCGHRLRCRHWRSATLIWVSKVGLDLKDAASLVPVLSLVPAIRMRVFHRRTPVPFLDRRLILGLVLAALALAVLVPAPTKVHRVDRVVSVPVLVLVLALTRARKVAPVVLVPVLALVLVPAPTKARKVRQDLLLRHRRHALRCK
jgi:hypothetical protein